MQLAMRGRLVTRVQGPLVSLVAGLWLLAVAATAAVAAQIVGAPPADAAPASAAAPGPILLQASQEIPDSLRPQIESMGAFAIGVAAEFAKEFAEALVSYEQAARSAPGEAQIFTRQAACLFELRRLPEALAAAAQALELDSLQSEAQWIRGISLASTDHLEEAIEPLRAATAQRRERRALHALVNILEKLGRREEMVDPLGALIEAAPSMLRLRERRAHLLIDLGRKEEAWKDFRAILADTPDYPGIHGRIEALLPLPESLEDRLEFYRALVEQQPGVCDFRWKLVRDLMHGERWDEAEQHLEALQLAEPANPLPHLQRALIDYRRGHPDRAFRRLADADSLAPALPLVDLWKMRLHFSENQADSALAAADRLLVARSRAVEALKVRAICLLDLGRREEALTALQSWAKQDAKDPQPLVLAASLLREQDLWEDGLSLMRRGVLRAPADAQLLVDLVLFLEKTGGVEEAEKLLRDFVDAHPDDPLALNALGYLLVEHDGDLDEAGQLLERAAEIDSGNPTILDSIGWLWYKRGDLRRAEKWLRRATRNGGQHPEILGHLARVQAARSRLDDALETLDEGLEIHPGDPHLQVLREELRRAREGGEGPEASGEVGNR